MPEERKEDKRCNYEMSDDKPCGRPLYDNDHCLFHSNDIERKKDEFDEQFWKEFERQQNAEEFYDFVGFVFPNEFNLKGANFQRAYLMKANLKEANCYGANLQEANLQGANLWKADLYDGNLQRAYINGANLQGADLMKANLLKASLYDTNLQEAYLEGANLQEANLQEANLQEANLQEANLQGAYLEKANLQKANLKGVNLQGANLQGANLKRANLTNSSFENANVFDVKYNRFARYRGIQLSNCFGDPLFLRFAKDQEYIEEFRRSKIRKPAYLLWLIFADCGRSMLLWSFWCLFFMAMFGIVFADYSSPEWFPEWLRQLLSNMNPEFSLKPDYRLPTSFTPYYFSIITFTTLGFGDVTPLNLAGEILLTIEVLLGYIMLGGLISILANKLARRS